MLGMQLIQASHLPEEAVTLSLLTQISIPRHLETTPSSPGPHTLVLPPVSSENKIGTHDIPLGGRVR